MIKLGLARKVDIFALISLLYIKQQMLVKLESNKLKGQRSLRQTLFSDLLQLQEVEAQHLYRLDHLQKTHDDNVQERQKSALLIYNRIVLKIITV